MGLPRMGSPRGATSRRVALWSALAVGGILPSVGCQVEYAGMTLPSGKYMHDDVQYFPSGPDFPWANTQAATQRARMRSMGIEPPPPPGAFVQPQGAGALNPLQNQMGRPTDVNMSPLDIGPALGPGGCLRHRNPVWPPAPCLPEIFLLAAAVPLPLRPELKHQRPWCRVVDAFLRLLRREETPNLERINRDVEATLIGVTERI